MKKLFSVLLLIAVLCASAAAEDVDFSGMSFDQLVALRERLNLAIWNSQDWQEVSVPAGTWEIGKDIPAGHWTIRVAAAELTVFYVYYFQVPGATGMEPDYLYPFFLQQIASEDLNQYGHDLAVSVDLDMQDGWFFRCEGTVVFTPFAGKPDLGFK